MVLVAVYYEVSNTLQCIEVYTTVGTCGEMPALNKALYYHNITGISLPYSDIFDRPVFR